jgi:hypothetical protein
MADVVRRSGLDVRFRCELFTGRRADVERLRRRLERLFLCEPSGAQTRSARRSKTLGLHDLRAEPFLRTRGGAQFCGGRQRGAVCSEVVFVHPTPEVHLVFADSRRYAEDWTYRFLTTALADATGPSPNGG